MPEQSWAMARQVCDAGEVNYATALACEIWDDVNTHSLCSPKRQSRAREMKVQLLSSSINGLLTYTKEISLPIVALG
jgi:hypothetical protein